VTFPRCHEFREHQEHNHNLLLSLLQVIGRCTFVFAFTSARSGDFVLVLFFEIEDSRQIGSVGYIRSSQDFQTVVVFIVAVVKAILTAVAKGKRLVAQIGKRFAHEGITHGGIGITIRFGATILTPVVGVAGRWFLGRSARRRDGMAPKVHGLVEIPTNGRFMLPIASTPYFQFWIHELAVQGAFNAAAAVLG
jgi:hypothetical protein